MERHLIGTVLLFLWCGCTGNLYPFDEVPSSETVSTPEPEEDSVTESDTESAFEHESDFPQDTDSEERAGDSDPSEGLGCLCLSPFHCSESEGWRVDQNQTCPQEGDVCCYANCSDLDGICVESGSTTCYEERGVLIKTSHVLCPSMDDYCCRLKGDDQCSFTQNWMCMDRDDASELERCINELNGTAGTGCNRETEVCCILDESIQPTP